ncbi:MAG TPA: hypothetical protein DEP66_02865, partial [Acidimicrobiaceae bacterium]|nr:hypothetical protein [Acidimicrobiaceae bacterium]
MDLATPITTVVALVVVMLAILGFFFRFQNRITTEIKELRLEGAANLKEFRDESAERHDKTDA